MTNDEFYEEVYKALGKLEKVCGKADTIWMSQERLDSLKQEASKYLVPEALEKPMLCGLKVKATLMPSNVSFIIGREPVVIDLDNYFPGINTFYIGGGYKVEDVKVMRIPDEKPM